MATVGLERSNAPVQHAFSTVHLLTNLTRRTVSSAFVTGAAQFLLFGITLGSTMVLARLLSPTDFGLVAMAMTALGLLRNLKNAGLSSATIQRENITHAQVSNLFWINSVVGFAAAVVVAACSPLIGWFYHDHRLVILSLALSTTFLFEGVTVQHTALLNREMRFVALAVIQVSALSTSVLITIAMAWYGLGYWSLVGAQFALPFFSMLFTWTACRWRPQKLVRQSGTRSLVTFGANLTASSFMYSVSSNADSLLIGRFYGADPVGLYSRAGALLRRPLDQFLTPINSVFIPALSRIQSDSERYQRTFLATFEAIALTIFAFGGVCIAISRPLTLLVLGPKWEGAVGIFAAFCLAGVVTPLAGACGWLFETQGRGKDSLVTSLWSCGFSISAIVAGLPFGASGVAFASAAAALILQLPLFFHFAGRSGPVSARQLWKAFLQYSPVWFVAAASTAYAGTAVGKHSMFVQTVIPAISGCVAVGMFALVYPPARRTIANVAGAVRRLKVA